MRKKVFLLGAVDGVAVLIAILVFGLPLAHAQPSYYEVPDVPTNLDGGTYLPWHVVKNLGGSYSLLLSLPDNTPLDAVYRRGTGEWLLSTKSAKDLGGSTWDPRDVFQFNGVDYTPFFDGGVAGVPAGSNVDAAFLIDADDLVISFDIPTTIGTSTYLPADLVTYSGGGFSLFFDGSSAGIPASRNVSAADHRAGLTLISLDLPTTVGTDTFLPGELVAWDGANLSLFDSPTAWPANRASQLDALSDFPSPGAVPSTISLERISATQLRIRWAGSDCAGGEDYGIYEGTIGTWDSHEWIDCRDDGTEFVEDVLFSDDDRYYLVVPHNIAKEGSYGVGPDSNERPVGTTTCAPVRVLGCNP